jgi:hypothetical protein
MKKLLSAILLSLALVGCSGLQPQLAVPTNMSQAGQEAAKAINETKVDLISIDNAIATQVSGGLMTKADAQALAVLSDQAWAKVKEAEALLGSGQDVLAKNQAALISALIVELQKQLVARSKKA